MAIEDLIRTYGDRYPKAGEYLRRLSELEKADNQSGLRDLQREAMLASPHFVFRFEGYQLTCLLTHITRSTDAATVARTMRSEP